MPWIWCLVLLVASFALEALIAKKPPSQKPALLSDFSFPQVDEGTPQGVYFGDNWTQGWQVLWYGNLRSTAIKAPSKK